MVNDEPHIKIPVDSNKQSELQHYQELLQGPDLDTLTARYPIHRSTALNAVPRLLGLSDRGAYQNTLLHLVTTAADLAARPRII